MKIRRDFVTNSSSSSFICYFRNKEDFENKMKDMLKYYSKEVVYTLKEDIEQARTTYTDARKEYKKYLEGTGKYELFWRNHDYKDYDYMKTPEFKKELKEYIDSHLEDFDTMVYHRGLIAIVNYEDHSDFGNAMEHEIMPRQPFVFERLNYH